MPTYRVEVPTEGFDLYLVEADSPEDAIDRLIDGELINSEVAWSDTPVVLGVEDE
jgi:hypothetical protein